MPLQDIRTQPTYVINLDRRKDRWDSFSAQPTLKEFQKLQRFSAVDGSKIDVLNDKRISPHTRINIMNKYRRSDYEINTPGAIGASLSHIGIWKNLVDSDAEYVVVFEDDTVVDDKTMLLIDRLIKDLPQGWDMWLLGHHKWMLKSVPLTSDKEGWQKVHQFTGAHGYVLSRRGAQILLEEPFPIETHIEYYVSSCARLKGLMIVKHPKLRMTYFQELTESDDSDTFDSFLSCPVCIVPDKYPYSGLYIPNAILERGLVAIAALGFVGAGLYYARR